MGDVTAADVGLDRDVFLRSLVRALAGALEEIIGAEEAAGYISLVGMEIGAQINAAYREALDTPRLDQNQVSAVLVDLKRRIQGDFHIVEETDKVIRLGNRVCPFGDKVIGRESMCMMTSNVFGGIVADNLGYAKVELEETIARGHAGCRVVVHLQPGPDAEAAVGREYYGDVIRADAPDEPDSSAR